MAKEGIAGLALGRKDILRINPTDLNIKPEWNSRDIDFDPTDADDLALAQSIATVGVKQPLTAVWEDGKAWLTDGHRRMRATLYAIEHLGAEIKSVPVQTEDRYASEAERVLSQIVRNNGKPLSPIEQSRVFKRLIDLGWTEKQIAESTGRSVPWVKGLLELNAAPTAVTALVRSGQVSATLAMSTLRDAKGDGEKAADVLTGAVENAAAVGKKKATKKHVAVVDAPERKTLAELGDELEALFNEYNGRLITHVKSGDAYKIVGVHFREFDMAKSIEYAPVSEIRMIEKHPFIGEITSCRVKFARSIGEMDFGRRFVFAEADDQLDFEL